MKGNIHMRDQYCQRGRRHAFSLIELLAVIAVIAILASLLVPTLSKAKQKALCVSCLNNLKQLSLAFQLYAADYYGRIPPNTPDGWVGGTSVGLLDGTNTAFLRDGLLFPFVSSLDV